MKKRMFIFVKNETLKRAFLQVFNTLMPQVAEAEAPDEADIILTDTAAPFRYLIGKTPVLFLVTSPVPKDPVPEWCIKIHITTAVAQISKELAKIQPKSIEEEVVGDDVVTEAPIVDSPLKILVVEDSHKHREAAKKQLAGHNVEIVVNFDDAVNVLTTRGHEFDVVLTDMLMPKGGTSCMGEKGMEHLFVQAGYGFAIAWVAVSNGISHVAILSDASHHDHPMSWAMDFLRTPITKGGIEVIFSNNCLIKTGVKNWIGMLNSLTPS